jgi:hypothetical protein
LVSPNGLFSSGFPTNTLCTPLSSPIRATCPAQSSLRFDFKWLTKHFVPLFPNNFFATLLEQLSFAETSNGDVKFEAFNATEN